MSETMEPWRFPELNSDHNDECTEKRTGRRAGVNLLLMSWHRLFN